MSADPTKRQVVVYVKDGKLTPQLAALIGRLSRSVPITVAAAPYSKRQLDHAVQQVVALDRRHKTPDVVQFNPDPAGQGLDIATTARNTAQTASELASIPVAIHYRTGATRLAKLAPAPNPGPDKARNTGSTQRWDPRFAHDGGAPVGLDGFCTLGTPVYDTVSGRAGYLTAANCGENGQAATSAGGIKIGTFSWLPTVTDDHGRWLNLNLGAVRDDWAKPFVWNNDIDTTNAAQPPTTEFTSPVEGTKPNILGNLVATDGTMSGQRGHSNAIQIFSTDNYVDLGAGDMMGPFVYAHDNTGQNATGNGDAGGEVHVADPADPTKEFALGIMMASDPANPASCTGYVGDKPWRHCTAGVYYADIADALYSAGGLTAGTG